MKKQLLFVDDDPFILAGLRRLLRSHREAWDIEFAESGQEALQRMEERLFDVIISDMRMPGMDGAQLLTEVCKRHPRTVRILLSGQSDEEAWLRAVGPAHQSLAKPCDPETLKRTVERACTLRDRLQNGALRRLVSRITTLPSLPQAYQTLLRELRFGDTSIRRVAEIIAADIAMTAKVLQLVNSSFFGLAHRTTSPVRAVQLLGINKIVPLALTAGVFSQLDTTHLSGLDFSAIVEHSLAVATNAKRIAASVFDDFESVEDAFLAGLLHDVGRLVLACNLPDQYQEAVDLAAQRAIPLWQAEMETFDADHAEVGAYLVGLWGLPGSIVEAIAFHHTPRQARSLDFTPLTAVHVANAIEHEDNLGDQNNERLEIDEEYLNDLGMYERLALWRDQRQSQFSEAV